MNTEDNKEHIQNLADPGQPIDEMLGDAEQKNLFARILREFGETLEGREKVIFENRLTSENPLTLQEIGDKYNITKERARQIEEQIKEKLKNYVSAKYPDFDLLTL